ncbi:MAG: NAD(P)H-binding protein [Polaribacter sp.]|jgi:uncharacterized protein YbjT (DUF2867 family)|nr:NAD(P)H-binding protein [Polaribacter sp.]MDG2356874.1 NAD(P)H-binding protein [Polaribacter sp.]
MGKTAIVLGATGLTGNFLLEKLITDSSYKKIKLFSRNSVHKTSTKIEEHLIDLFKLDTCKELFTGDVLFCCIGTTASKTKDKEVYKAIDYGIPVSAAKLATINNIKTFVVLSSMGANPSSSIFYNKTKGEMERDVLRQNIKNTYVLRPSLIGGNRDEVRVGERIGKVVMSLLGPFFLGPLKKYKIISPENIVSCMQKLAESEVYQSIFSSDEIVKIANSNKNK